MVEGIGVVLRMVRELNEAKAENARLRTKLEAVRKLRDEAIEAASVMSTRLDDLDAQLEAVRELVSTYDANHADWIVTRTAILAALGDEGGDDG
jgi:septation ring formation regulator EzrA